MGVGETFAFIALAGVAIALLISAVEVTKRFIAYKEAKLAAQGTAAENRALISRIEVLERIVTDRGPDLAGEIEALRRADAGAPLAFEKERV
ncbi:hypothetical protein [Alteraurantiacibacter buctensis]|uniref:Uncharacterized protein n=1 Tax=Alteraurantiacibacter buctensis TaxID=1503981 RepID=A0A844YX64_9SPHN|nr:hypothetical protein [Alteraurantiacibacter buctensis]MXO72935.1 hypothetical protein [Alteraurantiacibacter buctensis]